MTRKSDLQARGGDAAGSSRSNSHNDGDDRSDRTEAKGEEEVQTVCDDAQSSPRLMLGSVF